MTRISKNQTKARSQQQNNSLAIAQAQRNLNASVASSLNSLQLKTCKTQEMKVTRAAKAWETSAAMQLNFLAAEHAVVCSELSSGSETIKELSEHVEELTDKVEDQEVKLRTTKRHLWLAQSSLSSSWSAQYLLSAFHVSRKKELPWHRN